MSDFKTKMHQIRFRLGLRPRSRWGSSTDLLVGFSGSYVSSEWKEGKNKERDEFICAAA